MSKREREDHRYGGHGDRYRDERGSSDRYRSSSRPRHTGFDGVSRSHHANRDGHRSNGGGGWGSSVGDRGSGSSGGGGGGGGGSGGWGSSGGGRGGWGDGSGGGGGDRGSGGGGGRGSGGGSSGSRWEDPSAAAQQPDGSDDGCYSPGASDGETDPNPFETLKPALCKYVAASSQSRQRQQQILCPLTARGLPKLEEFLGKRYQPMAK